MSVLVGLIEDRDNSGKSLYSGPNVHALVPLVYAHEHTAVHTPDSDVYAQLRVRISS